MSVKKLRIKKDQYFVTILNKVAQGLCYDLELLGLFTYLCSLPPDWEFHKSHLQKVCNVGEKKLDKMFAALAFHGVIEIIHNRDSRGRFTFSDINVLDGNSFKNKDITPQRKNCGTVTHVRKSGATKDIIKNNINKKEIRATRSPKLHPFPDDFFPDEENRKLLSEHGNRTNNTEHELLEKFETVSKKYKTKSIDWQITFKEFLEREKPKKTYEDEKGKKKRYIDPYV